MPLEEEALAAKEWYEENARLYMAERDREVRSVGGHLFDHRYKLQEPKQPQFVTFESGIGSVFSTVVGNVADAVQTQKEPFLRKQNEELRRYCRQLEQHNDRLLYEVLHASGTEVNAA